MNINFGHDNYAQRKFYVYVSTDVTADAASCWTLAAFILALEKSEPKIWIDIKLCVRSAQAIPIQEAQILHCVDAAASDAENLCRWCLATPWIFFENFCPEFFKTTLQDVYDMPHTFYLVILPKKKNFVFMLSEYVANRECWSRVAVIG